MTHPTPRLALCASALLWTALAAQVPLAIPQPHQHPRIVSTTASGPVLAPPRVCAEFDVAVATLQALELPSVAQLPDALRVGLQLGSDAVVLDLLPFDVRAPGYQLLVRTAAGLLPTAPGPTLTWRGVVDGEPTSRVAATLFEHGLSAVVRRANGDVWIVQPLRGPHHGDGAAPKRLHVVHRGADALSGRFACGTDDQAASPTGASADSYWQCELALEADHALVLLNTSSIAATQADVLGVVNAVDMIYHNDLQVGFTVSLLVVDAATDPYTSPVAGTLLAQCAAYWNTTLVGAPRDAVHLFTGRSVGAATGGVVGLAYPNSVCVPSSAYSLAETRWSANWGLRVALTAHELGHTFGASHCDALPFCNIMCSSIGGCSGVVANFGPTSTAQIASYVQSVGCLALQPSVPQITGAMPVIVETVNPPLVTLTGSGFLGTTQVTVGGQIVQNGIQVIADTQLRFTPPMGLPLGLQSTTVTNPAGTSNATVLIYRGADPCQVLVPADVVAGGPIAWTMGGWPYDVGYLGIGFAPATTPFLGHTVLADFLPVWAGGLDALGLATFQVPAIPGLLQGFTFYSQMLDENAGALRSVSVPHSTVIH